MSDTPNIYSPRTLRKLERGIEMLRSRMARSLRA
jgi:hypothetical protein